jgi:hypothetical protein
MNLHCFQDNLGRRISVFSTALELRGADVPFFSCTGKNNFDKKVAKVHAHSAPSSQF